MANKNAPFGARLVGKLGSGVANGGTTEYEIASGASGNILSGDIVKMLNTGTILVAGAGDEPLGIFRGCKFTNSSGDVVFSSHFPDGTVSTDIVAFVEDDPNAVFEIQSAGSPAQTDVGLNADIRVIFYECYDISRYSSVRKMRTKNNVSAAISKLTSSKNT